MIIVDATLTAGVIGQPPLKHEVIKAWLHTLVRTGSDWNVQFQVELPFRMRTAFAEHLTDRGIGKRQARVEPVVRLEPRTDRFRAVAEAGVKRVVFTVPVSATAAKARFLHGGINRAVTFAAEQAEYAVLAGLTPEIELDDITRARGRDVSRVVGEVRRLLRPRNVNPHWRLLDRTGQGDPLAGARRPRSLTAWVRYLDREHHIDPPEISAQSADILGLSLANSLAVARMGVNPVTTAFGLGHHAGWTALEVLLTHLRDDLQAAEKSPSLRPLLELRSVLTRGNLLRDPYRPVSGPWAHQASGGTGPETLEERAERHFPYKPKALTGHSTLPMMDALSGQAGLLHLIHRHFQELHVETTDPEAHELARRMQDAFDDGRELPAAWLELRQLVEESGILERARGDID
ncbi:hypothetical protein GF324_10735 [bacterium]|nr:hypothetical protein [bacterium]